ncbi:hypothetical protein KASHIRA_02590 [Serratia phage vB_SmaM-Kashira]|nr:hypothetical protein KASHIRA_02590 [Serratia phage vB_SmaM-Kashira]
MRALLKIECKGKVLFNSGVQHDVPEVGEKIWVNFKEVEVTEVKKLYSRDEVVALVEVKKNEQ